MRTVYSLKLNCGPNTTMVDVKLATRFSGCYCNVLFLVELTSHNFHLRIVKKVQDYSMYPCKMMVCVLVRYIICKSIRK